jgi:hypothetical protein
VFIGPGSWVTPGVLQMEGWGRWNPLLEVLMWPSLPSLVVEKKVHWVKLVKIIDSLKEKAYLMVLNKLMPPTY